MGIIRTSVGPVESHKKRARYKVHEMHGRNKNGLSEMTLQCKQELNHHSLESEPSLGGPRQAPFQ